MPSETRWVAVPCGRLHVVVESGRPLESDRSLNGGRPLEGDRSLNGDGTA